MKDALCEGSISAYANKESEYKPSKQEMLSRYSINIQFYSVGCVINIGCKSIAFSDISEAMKAVNAYVEDPIKENERWLELIKNI